MSDDSERGWPNGTWHDALDEGASRAAITVATSVDHQGKSKFRYHQRRLAAVAAGPASINLAAVGSPASGGPS